MRVVVFTVLACVREVENINNCVLIYLYVVFLLLLCDPCVLLCDMGVNVLIIMWPLCITCDKKYGSHCSD